MANNFPSEDHIRNCMLYEFHRGKKATEATRDINKVYPGALDVRKCQRWFSKFREENFDLKDEERSGRPSKVDIDVLRTLIEDNPSQTLDELSEETGIDRETIHRHLKDMGKISKAGIWVPHELTEENKFQRFSICNSLILRHHNEPFLDRIVTGDEKWVMYDNPKRKRQWLSPGQSSTSTAKPNIHRKKVLLSVWWGIKGIIHFELLKPGVTINEDVYCDQLDRLKAKIEEKLPAIANRKGVMLHQDNARPHTSKKTLHKIKDFGWDLLPHPPYSPDIAPSDYHLFRSLQHYLAGKKFTSFEALKNALENFFASKSKSFYKEGIKKLLSKWEEIVVNEGEYGID